MLADLPTLNDVKRIAFKTIRDPRGTLTPIEGGLEVPFPIARIYYLYDVPGGSSRAGHSHKQLEQVLIALSGSFDVHLDDGESKVTFSLNRPYFGLYVPRMIWRDIDNFSSNAVCLSVASRVYEEFDYYRDYATFIRARQ